MPNPKVGTVTPDVANAVKNAKAVKFVIVLIKTELFIASIGKVRF